MGREQLVDQWRHLPEVDTLLPNDHKKTFHPKGLLAETRRNLVYGRYWAVGISVSYLAAALWLQDLWIGIGLLLMIGFNYWVARPIGPMIQTIDGYNPSRSIADNTIELVGLLEAWISIQMRVSRWMIPVFTLMGALLGIYSQGTDAFIRVFSKPLFWVLLSVLILLVSWVSLKLLAWMMLQSHGKDLNNWKTFLSDLEQE